MTMIESLEPRRFLSVALQHGTLLVRGTAERLPWADASFDRVFCVNALHHFFDARAFVTECRRVLRAGGGLLTIGLDPHTGLDRWWVYDFFPAALEADRQRYASTASIRANSSHRASMTCSCASNVGVGCASQAQV